MKRFTAILATAALVTGANWSTVTLAQNRQAPPPRGSQGTPNVRQPQGQASQQRPTQQAAPQQRGVPAQTPPQAPSRSPFQLSREQAAELDRVLTDWEKRSGSVKSLSCKFRRWEKDTVFNQETVADGSLQYEWPDKGLYEVEGDEPEKWACNGETIFEFKYDQKQLIEHPLPPELQGQSISNGPLPFFFGAKASTLKERYFLRVITSEEKRGQEVWIEAYPRHQQDAANFSKADLILNEDGKGHLLPYAMRVYLPGGKTVTTHQFYDREPRGGLFEFLSGNPFNPSTPLGWKRVVEQPAPQGAATQVGRVPPGPPGRQPQTEPQRTAR